MCTMKKEEMMNQSLIPHHNSSKCGCTCEKCKECKHKTFLKRTRQVLRIGIECATHNRILALKALLLLCFVCSLGAIYFVDPYCIQKLHYPSNDNNNNNVVYNNELRNDISSNIKASVVLMNFARPRNIQESKLMPVLTSHPNIDEILLLHANPKTIFNYTHDRVRNINATLENEEMGLALRFAFCSKVKTPYVIHVDDDIEFPPETIDELITEFQKNTKRIVGLVGREQTLLNTGILTNSYTVLDAPYETEVVLTRLMIMETEVCRKFVKYSPLMQDMAEAGTGPKWNGEDIFMSLVANHVYEEEAYGAERRPHYNYAMPWLPFNNVEYIYPGGFDYDINGGIRGFHPFTLDFWEKIFYMRKHLHFRGLFWKIAQKRLQHVATQEKKITTTTRTGLRSSTKSSPKLIL